MSRIHPLYPDREIETKPSPYSKGEWKLVECLESGLVYLDNPIAYEALEEEYAWEKTYQDEHQDRKEREPIFSKISDFSKRVRKAVRKIPKVESLPIELAQQRFKGQAQINFLDVGCGNGNFTLKIASKMDAALDSTVIPRGIEISKGLAQVSDEKLKGMDGEVVQAPAIEGMYELPDDSQDMILLHSFLEHEVNPLELLKASSKKLSKKGLLIIKVPNYESWNRKVRQAKWCGFRYPDHVNYFSPKTLKLFIEAANLKVYRMNFFDRIPTSDNVWVIAERKSS